MARPKAWRERAREEALRGPWTADEDAALIAATSCGLSVDHLKIEGRSFGEVMARRLELIEAGTVKRARAI